MSICAPTLQVHQCQAGVLRSQSIAGDRVALPGVITRFCYSLSLTYSVGVHAGTGMSEGCVAGREMELSLLRRVSKRPFYGFVCQRQRYHSFLETESTSLGKQL